VMADWLTVPLLNAKTASRRSALASRILDRALRRVPLERRKDILISIQSEREWKKLCADVLGHPTSERSALRSMVERVRNRALTDKTVGDSFAGLARDELLGKLAEADIAFAEVNTMADLAVHPHLRPHRVGTPNGKVAYPAPATIVVDQPRHYGPVPGIGDHSEIPKAPRPEIVMTKNPTKKNLTWTIAAMDRPHHEASDIVTAQLVKGLRATLFRRSANRSPATPRVDDALVPGPAGVSDVAAQPGRPSDSRRFPAAGAVAAPDVAGGELEFFDALRVGDEIEARFADLGRRNEDRQHRRIVFCLRRAPHHTPRGTAIRERQASSRHVELRARLAQRPCPAARGSPCRAAW